MGTCGGAPSSFLRVAGRRGEQRPSRLYLALPNWDLSQRPGRVLVRHFDVVCRVAFLEEFRVLPWQLGLRVKPKHLVIARSWHVAERLNSTITRLDRPRRAGEADTRAELKISACYQHLRRKPRDRAAVVAPDPTRDPTPTTSKFWGVTWHKSQRVWMASYTDANGKMRHIGSFDTQEQAAHAVNAAIRRAGLEGRRKTNPVVDGQLVPRARKAHGHGRDALRKRRREELAATPSSRARRPRRAVDYAEEEP